MPADTLVMYAFLNATLLASPMNQHPENHHCLRYCGTTESLNRKSTCHTETYDCALHTSLGSHGYEHKLIAAKLLSHFKWLLINRIWNIYLDTTQVVLPNIQLLND